MEKLIKEVTTVAGGLLFGSLFCMMAAMALTFTKFGSDAAYWYWM